MCGGMCGGMCGEMCGGMCGEMWWNVVEWGGGTRGEVDGGKNVRKIKIKNQNIEIIFFNWQKNKIRMNSVSHVSGGLEK